MFWALTSLAKCLKSIQANVTWENQKTAEKKRKICPNLKLPMQLSPKLHSCLFKFNNELVVRNDRAWLNEYSFLLIQQSKYKYRATHILISTRDFQCVIFWLGWTRKLAGIARVRIHNSHIDRESFYHYTHSAKSASGLKSRFYVSNATHRRVLCVQIREGWKTVWISPDVGRTIEGSRRKSGMCMCIALIMRRVSFSDVLLSNLKRISEFSHDLPIHTEIVSREKDSSVWTKLWSMSLWVSSENRMRTFNRRSIVD